MNPCELAAAITALAAAIAEKYPPEELAVLAASLVQLGETLETIVVQREYLRLKNCGRGNGGE